jgi:hypothetical protein
VAAVEEEVEEVVALEVEEGAVVEEEVEEYQNLISWMKHWILTFRCMPTVRSAQKILFFTLVIIFMELSS